MPCVQPPWKIGEGLSLIRWIKKVLEPVEQKNPISIREPTEATDSRISCLQIILLVVGLGFHCARLWTWFLIGLVLVADKCWSNHGCSFLLPSIILRCELCRHRRQ